MVHGCMAQVALQHACAADKCVSMSMFLMVELSSSAVSETKKRLCNMPDVQCK
jgi:hypothetical protein